MHRKDALKFLSYLGLCDIMYLSVMMHFVSMHQKVQELCFENQKVILYIVYIEQRNIDMLTGTCVF